VEGYEGIMVVTGEYINDLGSTLTTDTGAQLIIQEAELESSIISEKDRPPLNKEDKNKERDHKQTSQRIGIPHILSFLWCGQRNR